MREIMTFVLSSQRVGRESSELDITPNGVHGRYSQAGRDACAPMCLQNTTFADTIRFRKNARSFL